MSAHPPGAGSDKSSFPAAAAGANPNTTEDAPGNFLRRPQALDGIDSLLAGSGVFKFGAAPKPNGARPPPTLATIVPSATQMFQPKFHPPSNNLEMRIKNSNEEMRLRQLQLSEGADDIFRNTWYFTDASSTDGRMVVPNIGTVPVALVQESASATESSGIRNPLDTPVSTSAQVQTQNMGGRQLQTDTATNSMKPPSSIPQRRSTDQQSQQSQKRKSPADSE